MRLAIMQPYFFPYHGYFQLMASVDLFAFHDDVQYIKAGWVNRNRVLGPTGWQWLSVPVIHEDHHLSIRERHYAPDPRPRQKLLNRFSSAYRRTPHYAVALRLLEASLARIPPNVADQNTIDLEMTARLLGITTPFIKVSSLAIPTTLTGQARVIEICRRLGAREYINPIGGLSLYDAPSFNEAGLSLTFLRPESLNYPQNSGEHIPFLSILDTFAWLGIEQSAAAIAARAPLLPKASA